MRLDSSGSPVICRATQSVVAPSNDELYLQWAARGTNSRMQVPPLTAVDTSNSWPNISAVFRAMDSPRPIPSFSPSKREERLNDRRKFSSEIPGPVSETDRIKY